MVLNGDAFSIVIASFTVIFSIVGIGSILQSLRAFKSKNGVAQSRRNYTQSIVLHLFGFIPLLYCIAAFIPDVLILGDYFENWCSALVASTFINFLEEDYGNENIMVEQFRIGSEANSKPAKCFKGPVLTVKLYRFLRLGVLQAIIVRPLVIIIQLYVVFYFINNDYIQKGIGTTIFEILSVIICTVSFRIIMDYQSKSLSKSGDNDKGRSACVLASYLCVNLQSSIVKLIVQKIADEGKLPIGMVAAFTSPPPSSPTSDKSTGLKIGIFFAMFISSIELMVICYRTTKYFVPHDEAVKIEDESKMEIIKIEVGDETKGLMISSPTKNLTS